MLGLVILGSFVTLASVTLVAPRAGIAQTSDETPDAIEPSPQTRNQAAILKARETLARRERAQGREHPAVAESLHTLATLLRDGAEYAEARPLFARALAIREKTFGPEHPLVAATLSGYSYLLFLTGDHAGARAQIERSLAIREKALGPAHPLVAYNLNDLARVHETTGDPATARPLFDRALKIRESALGSAHGLVGASTVNLGRLLRELGDYAAARPLLERGLAISEAARGPMHPDVASGLRELGHLRVLTGDYAGARPLFERALRIREGAYGPDHPAVAISLSDLAWALRMAGDYAGARARYERAIVIQERRLGPNHLAVAQTLANLALVQRVAGDYAAARPLQERAITIREQALGPAHPLVAGGLSGLGFLLYLNGDFAAARPLFERALAIREAAQGPNHRDVASALHDLGLLLRRTGDLAGARRAFEGAVAIAERALGPDHADVAEPLTSLGALLRQLGDYAGARPPAERAVAIRERALGPTHPVLAYSLVELAALEQMTRQYARAQALYERALRIREQAFGPDHVLVARDLNALGFLMNTSGKPAEGRLIHERALRIRERTLGPDHIETAYSLNNLAASHRGLQGWNAALPLYERALPIVRRVQDAELRWRVAYGLAATYERRGRLTDALPLYRESVTVLEAVAAQLGDDTQRAQYLQAESRLTPYDALARVLLKLHESDATQGYDRDAWAVLEARKARVASEALAAARPAPRDPAARQAVERVQAKEKEARALERTLREAQEAGGTAQGAKRVESLTTLLAQTKAEYLAQAQAFLVRYPQYKTQFVDQQTLDPKALAKLAERLPAGTLVVQYFAAPDRLYLFVVAPGGRFQVKSRAVTQEALYALIKDYRTRLQTIQPLRDVTVKLSALLLEPVAAELRAHPNLVLVPNDLLLYLPIHALTHDGGGGTARYLAETHKVSYVTQLELTDLIAPTAAVAGGALLAVANPDGTLPAASGEVRELAKLRRRATALDGAEATKARFLSLVSQFTDLHLATHGTLDSERPERSYLLMAGPDAASQRLSVVEIASLSLAPNSLAVLSACETALGEQVPGAALITLAAAFSQAGAQSIVASLWKVSDTATRDFMVAFYRSLDGDPRVTALQKAQLAMLRNPATAHPYYWAPFILIGAR